MFTFWIHNYLVVYLTAEIDLFHQQRIADYKNMMQQFLRQEIQFYQGVGSHIHFIFIFCFNFVVTKWKCGLFDVYLAGLMTTRVNKWYVFLFLDREKVTGLIANVRKCSLMLNTSCYTCHHLLQYYTTCSTLLYTQ